MHVLRRNVDLNIILFNNEIYGLTKGQYSPTSRRGTKSPSTPQGSIDNPVSACEFALGAGARFVARSVDTSLVHMGAVLKRAHANKGASFVEIFQNCVVFNDGVFDNFMTKDTAPDAQLHLEHGLPLLFGKQRQKGLRLKPGKLELEVVTLGENGATLDDILVHDEKNLVMAQMLAGLEPPEFPVALGVLYCNPIPSYDDEVYAQIAAAGPAKGDLNALLRQGRTWKIE
jgi:2-oxoglutarate ferredoxin oxidoreductase subunit beta